MKLPLQMQHEVAGHDAAVGLRTRLSVYHIAYVAEIMENIEAVKHNQNVSLHKTVGDARVPHIIGLVQIPLRITPAGIDIEVCIDREVGWQFEVSRQRIDHVPCPEGYETLLSAGEAFPVHVGFSCQLDALMRIR